jgi:AAA domain, putative AbiEii toxin, Type IV TA system
MAQGAPSSGDVRLDLIEIHGYRSCVSTSFRPNHELSALIGVNGAGKTNILQAIRLVQARRGRPSRTALEQASRSAESEVTAWFQVAELRLGLKMRFSIVESSRRADELVAVSEVWNLQAITGSKAWKPLPPIEFFREGSRVVEYGERLYQFGVAPESGRTTRYVMENFDFELMRNPTVVSAVSAVADFRNGIAYYSASQFTDPTRCPSSFEVDEDGRLADAYGTGAPAHLKFLHDLYRLKQTNGVLYNEYCRFVSRQQLGLVSRLTWKEIELSSNTAEVKSGGGVRKVRKRKTLVIPKVQIGSSYITFNQLSEGTFKTLALAFYIITDSSKFLMVEEPEVCVHHGLLSRVVDTLKSYSKSKQTVISTHSDLLVDDLDPENIFVVEMTRSGTSVKQLNDWLGKNGKAALHTYLAESGSLGEYWRSGGLS